VMKHVIAAATAGLIALSAADAQDVAASDAVFRRAMQLVNDGEGAAGRALLDSMVTVAPPGSFEHAEALYWRASVAPSAMEAEQDYRRIILDHPLSPRIPDALLRLAQLELARGDRDNAIRHLQRLDLEYPTIPGRARTSFWLARAYLDQNDLARGCAAILEARVRVAAGDVELRNQLDFIAQRCPTTTVTTADAAPPPVTPPQSPAVTQPPSPPPASTVPAAPLDTRPSIPTPASPAPAAAASGSWSVQVAAFSSRSQANTLAERLRARGYEARVDGTAAPFRVRVGSYATRSAATAALREMQTARMEGFVVQVETR
jgi:cell division septation protein DedD